MTQNPLCASSARTEETRKRSKSSRRRRTNERKTKTARVGQKQDGQTANKNINRNKVGFAFRISIVKKRSVRSLHTYSQHYGTAAYASSFRGLKSLVCRSSRRNPGFPFFHDRSRRPCWRKRKKSRQPRTVAVSLTATLIEIIRLSE